MFNLLNTTNLLIISVTFLALSNFVIAVSWIKSIFRNKSLSSQIKDLNNTILSLNSRKPDKLAKITAKVHSQSNPSVTWQVVVNLRQIAYSSADRNKRKFEIVSIVSNSGNIGNALNAEISDLREYFFKSFIDGWIDVSSLKGPNAIFEWVKTISPEEERHQKLLDLGLEN
jgi:hypothetical protein